MKAILTDLDGVIRRWPASDNALERAHGLPDGSLQAVAFAPELLHRAITGRITDEVWRARITDQLARRYPDSRAADAVAAWSAHHGVVDAQVWELYARRRDDVRIVLVSNATSRLERDLAALGIVSHFHAIVNSSRVGTIKPEAGIFHAALQAAGARASDAVFVDDHLANVAAARALGIRAHHFTGAGGLAAFLDAAGLLAGAE